MREMLASWKWFFGQQSWQWLAGFLGLMVIVIYPTMAKLGVTAGILALIIWAVLLPRILYRIRFHR